MDYFAISSILFWYADAALTNISVYEVKTPEINTTVAIDAFRLLDAHNITLCIQHNAQGEPRDAFPGRINSRDLRSL